ncbi:MAG: DNA-binding protein [Gammaproteobacteria bacterium]|nr:MAG: DNA-binding protein [Gammaproteobacteria bacterium]
MLASLELTEDFNILGRQKKRLVDALLGIVNIPPIYMDVPVTREGDFRGFDGSKLYVVEQGSIAVRYQQRSVYVLDEGDILLPDITGNTSENATVHYGSDTGARVASYPTLEFMRRVFENTDAVKLWTRLLITYAGLVMRVAAARTEQDCQSTPGFERFEPGEIIIRQGERADYVFNLSEGVAEASVDGVVVGRVNAGEIFGAMAALTRADRSATITAKTRCSVVKVPKEQFTDLIRSNPATIHSLLVDMANSIVNLNEQLVGLQSSKTEE